MTDLETLAILAGLLPVTEGATMTTDGTDYPADPALEMAENIAHALDLLRMDLCIIGVTDLAAYDRLRDEAERLRDYLRDHPPTSTEEPTP